MTACTPKASTRSRGALAHLGEVIVVAPNIEASAIGHALTLRRPLRLEPSAPNVYEVDGTPTDCVNVAIDAGCSTRKPDLIVSGINKGYNLGDDVTYSGTVSGALEGALLGIPSIAVSLERTRGDRSISRRRPRPPRPSPQRCSTQRAADAHVSEHQRAPRQPQGHPRHRAGASAITSPSSTSASIRAASAYYWIEEGENDWEPHDRSDYQAVRDGSSRSRRCSRT